MIVSSIFHKILKHVDIFNNIKKRYLPHGSFKTNVITIFTGTTIAQAVPIAFSPILTRIYSPEQFGTLSLYISVVSIFSIIATLRYEHAIMLPEDDRDAANLVLLALFISTVISICLLIIVLIFNKRIAVLLNNVEIANWLYLAPFSVLMTGIYNSLNYWSNRKKQYKRLATSRVSQSVVTECTNLGIGLSGFTEGGLIAGSMTGKCVATGVLGWQVWGKDCEVLTSSSIIGARRMMVRYQSFPRYSLAADLINVVSNQSPIFLLNSFFSATVVGFYSLTLRVLGAPISLMANSILDVFKQRASADYRQFGNCSNIYNKTFKTLVFLSVIPFIIFIYSAEEIFALVFGANWRIAGEYAKILSILYFIKFVASPLSYTLYIAQKQKYDLIWQTILLITTVLSILIGIVLKNELISITLYTVTYSVMYIIYLLMSYKYSKG